MINWVGIASPESVEEVAVLREDGESDSNRDTPSPGRTTPPPTYEQCIKTAVPLSFMDFWPQCFDVEDKCFLNVRFETFDKVMQDANSWLKEQSNIIVRNCETVEIKVSSLDEYILYSTTKKSMYKNHIRPALYVKGLRVWYTSKILNKLPCSFATTPCNIAYINITPSGEPLENPTRYEKFSSLIEKFNNCASINGRILTVETVCIKEPEYENASILNMSANPDQSAWRDTYNKVALQFLRVYYLPDQRVLEELHYADFMPGCIRKSKHNPKYEDFNAVMDDCRLWLLQLGPDSRVLNCQTINGKYPNRSTPTPDPELTFHGDVELTPRIRFLRVYFVKPEGEPNQNYLAPLLSHKTFVPATIKRRHHETLATLMQRVEIWLRATGANVVAAETMPILESVFHSKGDPDLSVFRSEYTDGGTEYDQDTLLYVVRVYLDTVYPEPSKATLEGFEDEDCVIL